MNPNELITMENLIESIDKYEPQVIVCGSHHAVQLSGTEVPNDKKLSSVKIIAPMGAAVIINRMIGL